MNSSYFITQIEKNLKTLEIDANGKSELAVEYNQCFDNQDSIVFTRKLRVFNNKLTKLIDAQNMDGFEAFGLFLKK